MHLEKYINLTRNDALLYNQFVFLSEKQLFKQTDGHINQRYFIIGFWSFNLEILAAFYFLPIFAQS